MATSSDSAARPAANSHPRVPLSILELSPVSAGSDAAAALRTSLDLAVAADAAGYRRIWFAEHHTNHGVVSTSPAVLAALAAERTQNIRVGSGAVLLAHTPPAIAVEQFATIARLHPGRVDLGLGRVGIPTGGAVPGKGAIDKATEASPTAEPAPVEPAAPPTQAAPPAPITHDRIVEGLLVPATPPFTWSDPAIRARFTARAEVIGARASVPDYSGELAVALDLLGPGHLASDGQQVVSGVASGSGVELFSLASSPGESARVAGERGLPLAANYHVSPSSILETVAAYRAAFTPGVLEEPYVLVSADVLVAETSAEAQHLARGFEEWILGIRSLTGAIAYPAPDDAHEIEDEKARALVADRVRTRFVGSPQEVTAGLESLVRATGADELLLTTIAHDPTARIASFTLLAQEWETRAQAAA